MPSIHPMIFGTPDYFSWPEENHLVVEDYKYGHGFIDAKGNWQLINYVRGILDMFCIDAFREQSIKVSMTIHQPRNYDWEGHVRTWTVTTSKLQPYWSQLATAAQAATELNPVATTGAHCLYCPGSAHCAALQRAAMNLSQVALRAEPLDLTPQELGAELCTLEHAGKVLDSRIRGLKALAQAYLNKGEGGFGYSLQRTESRRVWRITPTQAITLGMACGVDVAKP